MQRGKSSNYARMLNEEDNNNYSRQCPGPKRLGVTFLASEWGSSKGGLSTLNRELAINIAKDPRVKVSYFVPSCNDEDKTAAHSHKIELIKAPRRPGLDELEWLNFPPKDLQIDVVVGHGVKLGHQAQIIRESHECKWIQVVHTDPEELGIYKEYANPISNAQKKHKTEVELCELADFVVPVGPKLYKAFRSYLASCEKEQCFFEFTPGILAEFSELKQSLEKREVCKVLCFGRGDSEDFKLKGFDIAARAMAKLSHCILLFVGAAEGKLEETRTRFLDFDIPPSQLRVRPFLDSREDLKKVFCEADLVVMPSRTEGFGLTGLEALSAGLPILVSRKSGFAEALLKIPFGRHFVVDSDDQDQWAKAIGEVCNNDRSSRLEECETLRDTYKKKYSWKKQCESLIDKMISITLDDKPEDCACAAEKSTLPHQTEVNNGLCSVSAHSAPGKLPIRIKLNRATFQESQSKDPAQEEEAKRLLMCEMTKHFIEIHAAQIPSKKFSQSLCYYLQGVHDLMIREAGEGSLRIVVECKTLEILEHLWDDYSSGHLNEVAEERLLTDEIKKKYDVESIELETTITMEDYLACKLSLRDLNRDSTVAENLTDPANAQPLVVHDEEQRELTTARFSLNLDSGRSARPNEFHPEQENGSLRLVSEMLSEEKTSQSSSMELPTYFRHVTVTQDSAPTKERDNSLQFSVGCRDLESLELLWSDYRSGRLDWMAEKFLLTDDIKKRFHVESVTLETSILEEDYLACKEHLLNISQNSGNSLMGDDDDTEILVTERTIQTANTDDLGIQTSKEAISQLPNQSETVIPVEEKSETTEEQQIIAGKMIENSGNSFVGDGEDTEILLAEGAIQTANTDDLGIQTSIEAISQLVDHSKTVIPVEEKNETTEEQQIIAGKIIGLQEGKGFSDVFDTHESPPSKDGKERR
nr:uncharacterized protein LOC131774239 [Pocillopora verrucosa]